MIATMYEIPFRQATIFVFGGVITGNEIAIRLGVCGTRRQESVRYYDFGSVREFMGFQMEVIEPFNFSTPAPEISFTNSRRVSFTDPIAFNGPEPKPLLSYLLAELGPQDNYRNGVEVILWKDPATLHIAELHQEQMFIQAIYDFFTPSTEPYKW